MLSLYIYLIKSQKKEQHQRKLREEEAKAAEKKVSWDFFSLCKETKYITKFRLQRRHLMLHFTIAMNYVKFFV